MNNYKYCYEPSNEEQGAWFNSFLKHTDEKGRISKIFQYLVSKLPDFIPFIDGSIQVLDIGCGEGTLARDITQTLKENNFSNIAYYGMELNKDHIKNFTQKIEPFKLTKLQVLHASFLNDSAFELLPNNSNFILASHIAYYAHDTSEVAKLVRNIHEKAKDTSVLAFFHQTKHSFIQTLRAEYSLNISSSPEEVIKTTLSELKYHINEVPYYALITWPEGIKDIDIFEPRNKGKLLKNLTPAVQEAKHLIEFMVHNRLECLEEKGILEEVFSKIFPYIEKFGKIIFWDNLQLASKRKLNLSKKNIIEIQGERYERVSTEPDVDFMKQKGAWTSLEMANHESNKPILDKITAGREYNDLKKYCQLCEIIVTRMNATALYKQCTQNNNHNIEFNKNNVPRQLNNYFLYPHKENYIEQIDQKLKNCEALIINGIEGSGKTSIARDYGTYAEKQSKLVWWFSAESESEFVADYYELAKTLPIEVKGLSVSEVIRSLNKYLSQAQCKDFIFILNDMKVDFSILFHRYLYSLTKNFKFIIIPQSNIPNSFNNLEMKVDSIIIGQFNQTDVQDVLYQNLKETKITFEEIIALTEQIQLTPTSLNDITMYFLGNESRTVETFIRSYQAKNFDWMFENVTNDKNLLNLLQYIPYLTKKIPIELLKDLIVKQDISDEIINKFKLLPLVLSTPENNYIIVESLFQNRVSHYLQKTGTKALVTYNKTGIRIDSPNEIVSKLAKALINLLPNTLITGNPYIINKNETKYITQIEKIIEEGEKSELITKEMIELYNLIAKHYSNLNIKIDMVLELYDKVLERREILHMNNGYDKAITLINKGHAYMNQKDSNMALKFFDKAYKISKSMYFSDKSILASVSHEYALVHISLNHYSEALPFAKLSLSHWLSFYECNDDEDKINSSDLIYQCIHIEVARVLFTLGNIYTATAADKKEHQQILLNKEALKYYSLSLGVSESISSQDHRPFTALILYQSGKICQNIGNYKWSIEFLEKAAKIYKELSLPEDLAISLYTIALGYKYLNNHTAALVNFKGALQVSSNPTQGLDPLSFKLYYGIGVEHLMIGNEKTDHTHKKQHYSEALEYFRKADSQCINNAHSLSNDDCFNVEYNIILTEYQVCLINEILCGIKTLESLNTLVQVKYKYIQKEPLLYESVINLALDISIRLTNTNNQRPKNNDIIKYIKKYLEIIKDKYPETSTVNEAIALVKIAYYSFEDGFKKTAIYYYQEALNIYKSLDGNNYFNLEIATIAYNMAAIYNELNNLSRKDEFLRIYEEALNKCNLHHTSISEDDVKLATKIAGMYSVIEKFDMSSEYYTKASDIAHNIVLRYLSQNKLDKALSICQIYPNKLCNNHMLIKYVDDNTSEPNKLEVSGYLSLSNFESAFEQCKLGEDSLSNI